MGSLTPIPPPLPGYMMGLGTREGGGECRGGPMAARTSLPGLGISTSPSSLNPRPCASLLPPCSPQLWAGSKAASHRDPEPHVQAPVPRGDSGHHGSSRSLTATSGPHLPAPRLPGRRAREGEQLCPAQPGLGLASWVSPFPLAHRDSDTPAPKSCKPRVKRRAVQGVVSLGQGSTSGRPHCSSLPQGDPQGVCPTPAPGAGSAGLGPAEGTGQRGQEQCPSSVL